MTNDSKDTLRAASFEPKAKSQSVHKVSDNPRPVGTWIALASGAVLLGLVVFVLPQFAPKPQIPSSSDASTAVSAAPAASMSSAARSQESVSERSPFAEAQLAKVRRSAQEVLQSLLETQSRLESRVLINGQKMVSPRQVPLQLRVMRYTERKNLMRPKPCINNLLTP